MSTIGKFVILRQSSWLRSFIVRIIVVSTMGIVGSDRNHVFAKLMKVDELAAMLQDLNMVIQDRPVKIQEPQTDPKSQVYDCEAKAIELKNQASG